MKLCEAHGLPAVRRATQTLCSCGEKRERPAEYYRLKWGAEMRKRHADHLLYQKRIEGLVAGLETLSNDFRAILRGDDMSGMSDRVLFRSMLKTARAALKAARRERP